jgi:BirA family biotin operon repressor/biotin-[acetyl-CoA-carboxylase] ligase
VNQLQPFDCAQFEAIARSRELALGQSLAYHSVTTSTSDVLLEAIGEGAPHGLVVLADHQTAGRGRRGRTWTSDVACENLLFSVLLRVQCNSDTASNVTLAIGLALHDALQPHIDADVGIKWINDIVVRHRKLAGILVESQIRGSDLALSVGIGINVHMSYPPSEIRSIATSLRMLGARELRREVLLADILEHLSRRVALWQDQGFSSIVDPIRDCDALIGHKISVDDVDGLAEGIDDSGALLLRVGSEPQPRRLINGFVQYLDIDEV